MFQFIYLVHSKIKNKVWQKWREISLESCSGKANSLRVMRILSGLCCPRCGEVQPGRSHLAPTAETLRRDCRGSRVSQSPLPQPHGRIQRAAAGRTLSAPGRDTLGRLQPQSLARWPWSCICLPLPLARPAPSGGTWVSLKPTQPRFIILRLRGVWGRKRRDASPSKLLKSSLSVSFCHQYFLTLFLRSYKAYCREILWVHVCLGDWPG